nr:retrovirus-related Pol polyprotein from transposon TNT 1-94 [Tanacetum cinerariifolium]
NRALLSNFMEKFLGTVCFGNNDIAVITGYGDVGLEVVFRKSSCFVRNEHGEDLLTGDRSSKLYTIALNKIASNSSNCLNAKASSLQSWLWHQRLSHLNFATINNLVKNILVRGLPKMKFEKDHLCSAYEQGKIHRKHHKSKKAFASNQPLYLLHMDLCGPMRVKSINGKRYVLVVVYDYSRYTWVFFLHSKDEVSEVIISFIKKTQVNLQLQVQHVCVRTNNGMEFINKTLAKFFDEESSSSSLNDDVQKSLEEVILPQTNTQSISNNMVPTVDEASIDYNETFAPVARIKTIRLFLAYAPHKDFTVFQMDVKITFFNGILEEKVYVGQPPGFVSTQYPDHVYALDKAFFQKGSIDTTLFIKKKDLMVKCFEMSMMREMKFFLGLQVNQFSNGIFINQSKCILDILKRFRMENCDTVSTPMVEQAKFKLDLIGKPVDDTDYQSMIGSLMYVTSSRPDIMVATCMCTRYQVNPNEHHVSVVKRIFRYLKVTIKLGLWYQKDFGFDLTAYSDADHAGCHLDKKSTSGSVQFLGDKLVCWSSKKQNCVSISTAKSEYVAVSG